MGIYENLDWLIYGVLIGLFVPIILLLGNKQFGISSVLQNICSIVIPKSKKIFSITDLETNKWKFYFALGIIIGAFLAANIFSEHQTHFLPEKYYSLSGIVKLFFGGILIGFGTRYAKGCTSGHSITGLSLLQLSSLIATVSFFVGGLIYTFVF